MVAILAMAASAIPYSTIMTLPSFLSLSPSVLKKVSQGLVSFELARQVDTRASQSQPHTQSFMPSVTPDEICFHGQRPCHFPPSLVFLPQALRCVLCCRVGIYETHGKRAFRSPTWKLAYISPARMNPSDKRPPEKKIARDFWVLRIQSRAKVSQRINRS